jgi:hypothetical protein
MENTMSEIQIRNISKGQVYLAFFDILGFKQVNESNDNGYVVDAYSDAIREAVSSSKIFFKNILQKSGIEQKSELEDDLKLVYTIISDSIVIHTKNNEYTSFLVLLSACVSFLNEFIDSGLPLRGCISTGDLSVMKVLDKEMSINSSILLGKPIIEAFELEKRFNWSGCTISKKLVDYLQSDHPGWNDGMYPLILKHIVPKKQGPVSEEYVVNWVTRKASKKELENMFAAHGKSIDTWEVKQKIDNTYEFIQSVPSIVEQEYRRSTKPKM